MPVFFCRLKLEALKTVTKSCGKDSKGYGGTREVGLLLFCSTLEGVGARAA